MTTVESLNLGGVPVAGLLGQLAEYEAALEAAGMPDGEVNHNNPVLFILWTAHNNYYNPLYDDDDGTAPDEVTVFEAEFLSRGWFAPWRWQGDKPIFSHAQHGNTGSPYTSMQVAI